MKRYTYYYILYGLLILLTVSCGTKQDDGNPLKGMWTLSRIEYPSDTSYVLNYPRNGNTWILIYEDSLLYMCQMTTSESGISITPDTKGTYTYIDKGNGNNLYFENNIKIPLTIESDTSIVIQYMGIKRTFKRYHGELERRVDEIRNIVNMEDESDENAHRYVISTAEQKLETTNHTLGAIIIIAALIMLGLIDYSVRMHRNKKRIESQLAQMERERSLRPLPVQNALNEVEAEFLHSDYYHRLRKYISEGNFLTAEDWSELDSHLVSVYPQFHSSLLALCPMSQTEIQVCSLIKIRINPSEIASAMCKEASSVSTIRSRLYRKVFDKKGSSHDWDEFILSL